jgi:hypothetical protein
MNTQTQTTGSGSAWKTIIIVLLVLAALVAAYFAIVLNWNYSTGERAGWVQKFSRKGWLCKTWEGELALVTMPGTTQEKFLFTVWDDAVAEQINRAMGKRVSLHYEEKIGLPTSCFGETRHFVTGVKAVEDIPLAPGIVVPSQPAPATPAAPAQPAPAPAPMAPPSPQNEYSPPQPAAPK